MEKPEIDREDPGEHTVHTVHTVLQYTRYYSPLYHFYTVMVICKCRGVEAGIQIMCDHCGMWYHIACIGMAKDSPLLNDSNARLCGSCK